MFCHVAEPEQNASGGKGKGNLRKQELAGRRLNEKGLSCMLPSRWDE